MTKTTTAVRNPGDSPVFVGGHGEVKPRARAEIDAEAAAPHIEAGLLEVAGPDKGEDKSESKRGPSILGPSAERSEA